MNSPIESSRFGFLSAKTMATALLVLTLIALQAINLYYDRNSITNLLQIKAADSKTATTLTKIETQLQQIEQELQKPKSDKALTVILAQLNALQATASKLPSQADFLKLQEMVLQINKQLTQRTQMDQHNTTSADHQKPKAKHKLKPYRAAHHLPFTVTGIDIWNGESMATINVSGEPVLMAKNDALNGWTLIALSFEPGRALFKNDYGEQVVVNLR